MRYNHRKYTWTKPFGSVRHSWSFVGEHGGIELHVSVSTDNKWDDSAGVEIHRFKGDGAPNHLDCWLLKSPCWHDGSSLYASETLWPVVKSMLPDHDAIFRYLEGVADDYFEVKGGE
jgi:hypothetical protein